MKDDNITKAELIDELKELRNKNEKLKIELLKKEEGLWIDEIWFGYDQSPIPTLILSKDGKIIKYNKAMSKLTGYSHEEVPDIETRMTKIFPVMKSTEIRL